jgi:ABC-2 type transport system permease protein
VSAERLPLLRAAYVIARRDFMAIMFSRAFFFFLLGPLFPVAMMVLAGGVGQRVESAAAAPQIGIAMQAADVDAMLAAHGRLRGQLGAGIPEKMIVLERLEAGQSYDARAMLERREGSLAAVLTGTPAAPELTAPVERLRWWTGPVALIAADARQASPLAFPEVVTHEVATSGASETQGRMRTAQVGQLMLFLLTMLLAGMVLSNLVEEKANKVIEILAAAIPMDAVFLGKLFAMLAISLVGIVVWAAVIGGMVGLSGFEGLLGGTIDLANLPAPGVGWPAFFLLAAVYFSMSYLLLGSIFLAIGSLASTVREVQTLSMPVTMLQVLLFFFASLAMGETGKPIEWAAIGFPLSSPYAMLARAAQYETLWPHAFALAWQLAWVLLFIRFGAALFRKRVMKSGPQGARRNRGLGALVSAAFSRSSKNVL